MTCTPPPCANNSPTFNPPSEFAMRQYNPPSGFTKEKLAAMVSASRAPNRPYERAGSGRAAVVPGKIFEYWTYRLPQSPDKSKVPPSHSEGTTPSLPKTTPPNPKSYVFLGQDKNVC